MNKETIENYAAALAASNWAGVNRLRAKNYFTNSQHLDAIFTAAALLWAEGEEPARSNEYKAIIEVMKLIQDDRIADAQQFRHDNGK
jgi:hypothetical protein